VLLAACCQSAAHHVAVGHHPPPFYYHLLASALNLRNSYCHISLAMSNIVSANNPPGNGSVVQPPSRPASTDPIHPSTPPNWEPDDPIQSYSNSQVTPTPSRCLPPKVELTRSQPQTSGPSPQSLSEARPLAHPYRKDDTKSRAEKSMSAARCSHASSVASDSPSLMEIPNPNPDTNGPPVSAPTPTLPGLFNNNPLDVYLGKSRDPREPPISCGIRSIPKDWDEEESEDEMDVGDPRLLPGPKNSMEALINAYLKTRQPDFNARQMC